MKNTSTKNLYTVLIEYRGGSYPYQVWTSSEYNALKQCIENINISEIDYLGPKRYNEL